MLRLSGGDGGEGGIDPVLRLGRVAGDLEAHQRGVAVGRDLAVAGRAATARSSTYRDL